MDKLSFRSKKQDPGDLIIEEGHSPHSKPSFNNKGEEGGTPFYMFALDVRSLALFRVVMGMVIIVDILSRSRSLFAHYANLGVWPIVEAINNINAHSFSFHFSNGNVPFQIIITIVTLLVAISFTVGYKGKASSIAMWLMVLSLHNRNILVLNPGDDFLRMLLFWGMFLPLSDRFSIDHASLSSLPSPTTNKGHKCVHVSLSGVCLVVQVGVVYWLGYVLKTGIEWDEGDAMYYLFSIDQYTAPFGYFVLRFPSFLVLLTHVYVRFELLMPVLIIFPIANASTRLVACFASFAIYGFLALCLELGMFTCAPILASLALLPSSFWDKILPNLTLKLSSQHNKYWAIGSSTTLYYATTGAYHVNTKFALQVANTFLGLNSPILAADKTPPQQQQDESDNDVNAPDSSADIGRYLSDNQLQWIAVDGAGKRHARHRGVLALLAENPFTAVLVPLLSKIEKGVAFIYHFYAFVARIPAVQGAVYTMASHTPQPYSAPAHTRMARGGFTRVRLSDLAAVGFLAYILWWNIGTVNSDLQMSGGTQWLGLALRIDQWWNMFTPSPMKDDGWFVIPARLANGKEVDLFKGGGPITYEKPAFVSRSFKDSRWRRYLMNLWSGAHQEKRLFYGRYLCRQWNWYGKGSSDKDYLLKTFRIVYLREITLPNYKVKGPEPIVLWEHQC